jgi:DNA-binding NtrC family response regulator
MPALRERREDIPLIAGTLLAKIDERSDRSQPPLSLDRHVLDALSGHDWPGNVRELRNVLERAAYLSRAQGLTQLSLSALPISQRADENAGDAAPKASFEPGLSYRETRARFEEEFEKQYVSWLLDRHEGNVSKAAREVDMDRKYLYRLAKKHGLKE